MQPVFMGGTGRSGTTVTAALIDRHPAFRRIRTEVKFVAVKGGLCDLAEGRTSYDAFAQRVLGEWFHRGSKGLQAILDRSAVEAALPELCDGLRADPWAAGRAFTHRLLDPIAEAAGAGAWIEMTPANVLAARGLYRMFPDMRLIHSVRDGRDAACSVVPMPWGPDDLDAALDWWGRKLERGFAACDALPPDRVLVVQMEDLIIRDRERQYARIIEFLGVEDDPVMHAFFDSRMTADGTHAGRWRTDVPEDRRAAFEAHYRTLADQLAIQGRPYHPLDDAVVGAGSAEAMGG